MGISLLNLHPLQLSSLPKSFNVRYRGGVSKAIILFQGPECSGLRSRIVLRFPTRRLVKLHCTSERVVDDWFDLVLREDHPPLVILLAGMENGWQKDLLEAEYGLSAEKSYSVLFMQAGSIGGFFEPLAEEVKKTMLDAAYRAKFSSWRCMLTHFLELPFHAEEGHKGSSVKARGC